MMHWTTELGRWNEELVFMTCIMQQSPALTIPQLVSYEHRPRDSSRDATSLDPTLRS
jgi:hypothetical protein